MNADVYHLSSLLPIYKATHFSGKRCMCTIIPPHIIDKIKEAYDDPILCEQLTRSHEHHESLRKERGLFFSGTKTLPTVKSKRVIKVYSANNSESLPGEKADLPQESSDVEIKEAYQWAEKTNKFFEEIFGRDSIDGKGMQIVSTVHYGRSYDNAFWNGSQMVYGDGDGKYFTRFTKGLEITGHEIFHGITMYDQELLYQDQSGALNESLSDAFGSMIKQHANGQNFEGADWLIGDDLMIGNGYSLRSMKAPGTAYLDHPALGSDPQPASMDAYIDTKEDNGGVHLNSGIPNKAFYLACQKFFELDSAKYAKSWDGSGSIWYLARRNVSPNATFKEFAQATIDVAKRFFGKDSQEEKAIKYAWSDVKVLGVSTQKDSVCITV